MNEANSYVMLVPAGVVGRYGTLSMGRHGRSELSLPYRCR